MCIRTWIDSKLHTICKGILKSIRIDILCSCNESLDCTMRGYRIRISSSSVCIISPTISSIINGDSLTAECEIISSLERKIKSCSHGTNSQNKFTRRESWSRVYYRSNVMCWCRDVPFDCIYKIGITLNPCISDRIRYLEIKAVFSVWKSCQLEDTSSRSSTGNGKIAIGYISTTPGRSSCIPWINTSNE